MKRVVLAISLVLACRPAVCLEPIAPQCEVVDVALLRELVLAKNFGAVTEVRSRVPRGNVVFDAVTALRSYELSPSSGSRTTLVRSVPRSTVEVEAFYQLTYPSCLVKERPHLFTEYLEAVFSAARRSRRDYETILRLPVLAQGGDLGAALSGLADRLYSEDPRGVMKALVAMPRSERQLICGAEIPCP